MYIETVPNRHSPRDAAARGLSREARSTKAHPRQPVALADGKSSRCAACSARRGRPPRDRRFDPRAQLAPRPRGGGAGRRAGLVWTSAGSKGCQPPDAIGGARHDRGTRDGAGLQTGDGGALDATPRTRLGACWRSAMPANGDLYGALDWLTGRSPPSRPSSRSRHLVGGTLVLYDVTSTCTGRTCELARRGYTATASATSCRSSMAFSARPTDVPSRSRCSRETPAIPPPWPIR